FYHGGILNGIDVVTWNPRTDPHIVENYDLISMKEGKAKCKSQLQEKAGLKVDDSVVLVSFVGRLTGQKGIDIILEAMELYTYFYNTSAFTHLVPPRVVPPRVVRQEEFPQSLQLEVSQPVSCTSSAPEPDRLDVADGDAEERKENAVEDVIADCPAKPKSAPAAAMLSSFARLFKKMAPEEQVELAVSTWSLDADVESMLLELKPQDALKALKGLNRGITNPSAFVRTALQQVLEGLNAAAALRSTEDGQREQELEEQELTSSIPLAVWNQEPQDVQKQVEWVVASWGLDQDSQEWLWCLPLEQVVEVLGTLHHGISKPSAYVATAVKRLLESQGAILGWESRDAWAAADSAAAGGGAVSSAAESAAAGGGAVSSKVPRAFQQTSRPAVSQQLAFSLRSAGDAGGAVAGTTVKMPSVVPPRHNTFVPPSAKAANLRYVHAGIRGPAAGALRMKDEEEWPQESETRDEDESYQMGLSRAPPARPSPPVRSPPVPGGSAPRGSVAEARGSVRSTPIPLRPDIAERGMIVVCGGGQRVVIDSVLPALDEVWVIPETSRGHTGRQKFRTAQLLFYGEWSSRLQVTHTLDVPADVEAILGPQQLEQLRELTGMAVRLEPVPPDCPEGELAQLVVGPSAALEVKAAVETIVQNVSGLLLPGVGSWLASAQTFQSGALQHQTAEGLQAVDPWEATVCNGNALPPVEQSQWSFGLWPGSCPSTSSTSSFWQASADGLSDEVDGCNAHLPESAAGIATGPSWISQEDEAVNAGISAKVVPPWRKPGEALPPPPQNPSQVVPPAEGGEQSWQQESQQPGQDPCLDDGRPGTLAEQLGWKDPAAANGPQQGQKRQQPPQNVVTKKQKRTLPRPCLRAKQEPEDEEPVPAASMALPTSIPASTPGATSAMDTDGERTVMSWANDQEQFAHLPPLPEGWIRVPSKSSQNIYYMDLNTGQSTFKSPLELPEGWVQQTSRSTGQAYFWNAELQVSQFVRPAIEWMMVDTGNNVTGHIQVLLMGNGDECYVRGMHEIARRFPGRVAGIAFDPVVEHIMYAGSDLLLMPSRYEPCGLPQMCAQRYGTVPLVTLCGGLKVSKILGKPVQEVEQKHASSELLIRNFSRGRKHSSSGFVKKRLLGAQSLSGQVFRITSIRLLLIIAVQSSSDSAMAIAHCRAKARTARKELHKAPWSALARTDLCLLSCSACPYGSKGIPLLAECRVLL
ncbi:unnamed protein product, partial [Polarella glacialis]